MGPSVNRQFVFAWRKFDWKLNPESDRVIFKTIRLRFFYISSVYFAKKKAWIRELSLKASKYTARKWDQKLKVSEVNVQYFLTSLVIGT